MGQQVQCPPHFVLLLPRHRHGELVGKRWVPPQPPQLDLRIVKALVILLRRCLYHVVLRGIGLDDRPSRLAAASRAADDLGQQVKGALRGAVVVHVQGRIGPQYAYQCHIFKIQPLGHHLGAQKDGHALLLELPQDGLVPHRHRVRVHPQQRRAGKQSMQLLLHSLGSHTDVLEPTAALGTRLRRLHRVAAVVAHQPSVGAVVRQVYAASRALWHVGTLGTQQLTAAAPPVEEQDALLPPRQIFLQFIVQRTADDAVPPLQQFLAQIR